MITLDHYQRKAFKTAKPTTQNCEYMVLGLDSEAGEVAGKLKKRIRGDYDALHPQVFIDDIAAELGDVLWYVAGLATVLGLGLDDIAEANLAKLADRANRGVIAGSGDAR